MRTFRSWVQRRRGWQRRVALPAIRARRIASILPGLLFAAELALFASRLQVPTRYMFDEVYHAYTAGQYVAGNRDAYVWYTQAPPGVAYMWNHPPLGLHLISLGIRLWGDDSYGWRFASALFGAIGVVLAYFLALSLTRRTGVAALAAAFLLTDGLYFVQARIAMLDIFGVVFMMGAFLCFHRFWTAPAERVRGPLLGTGLCLGLAMATKWNAAYASALVGLAVVGRMLWAWRAERRTGAERRVLGRSLPWVGVGLVAIPPLVYLLAYVPFFMTGHDLGAFVELQKQIFYYHARLQSTHPSQSSWWQWPLAWRPVWYYMTTTGPRVANIYANGNPILYWALVPAVLWLTWRWGKNHDPGLATILLGFFGQWLPWALVPRIAFAYHFLPAVPFGCVALAVMLARAFGLGTLGRALAVAYGITVVAAFAFFFPIYAALPLMPESLALRMWFPTWR